MPSLLITERLILRQWRASDGEPFARLNADPVVMRHFPRCLSHEESDAAMARTHQLIEERGWGFWAVEVRAGAPFIGFVGLSEPGFRPGVEIGWRLAREHWGQGYATEAATASMRFGFEKLTLEEVVAFTVPLNERSRRVMQRIGLSRDPADDFDHPKIEPGHPLRRHVLYRMKRSEWEQRQGLRDAPLS